MFNGKRFSYSFYVYNLVFLLILKYRNQSINSVKYVKNAYFMTYLEFLFSLMEYLFTLHQLSAQVRLDSHQNYTNVKARVNSMLKK